MNPATDQLLLHTSSGWSYWVWDKTEGQTNISKEVRILYTGDHNKHIGSLNHPGESHVSVLSKTEDIKYNKQTKEQQKNEKNIPRTSNCFYFSSPTSEPNVCHMFLAESVPSKEINNKRRSLLLANKKLNYEKISHWFLQDLDDKHTGFPTYWGWCIGSSSRPPAAFWPQWRRTSVWPSTLLSLLPSLTRHLHHATGPTWLHLHLFYWRPDTTQCDTESNFTSLQDRLVLIHLPVWTKDTCEGPARKERGKRVDKH